LREGLPRSFQEALAYGCALLADVDPDGLVQRFGFRAADTRFGAGLDWLMADRRWHELGLAGRSYITATYGREMALDRHESIYASLVAGAPR
jgi:hypothetical protein